MQTLDLKTLTKAVAGGYAAVKRVTRMQVLGEKIFPPTYEGGEYATEQRQVRGADDTVQTVETVLLDSVQSQANRMEMALLRAYDAEDGSRRCRCSAVNFSMVTEVTQFSRRLAGLRRLKRPIACATPSFATHSIRGSRSAQWALVSG